MNFADEEYVRLYTSDTITWDMLPWQALALLALALRKFDRSGVFEFGKHGAAVALSVKTRLPLDIVTAGLQEIVDSGTWTVSGTRIYWPTYIEAQTCRRSERVRKREERARKLNEQRPESGYDSDKCHTEPPKTDKCHTESNVSHSVTPGEAGRRRGVGEAGQGILNSGDSDAREPERQQLLRESDSNPAQQPAQRAPQEPSGSLPSASGAPVPIPAPESQPGALASQPQICNSTGREDPPRPPTRRERATSDMASLPISELARRCRENPHDAGFAAPQDRPEVRQVHEAWCRSVGLAVRPLGYLSDRNRPLRAILEALETNSLVDVLRACEQASRDPWCRGEVPGRSGEPGRKHGVEDLTPTVLRRLLDAADERKPEIRSPRVQKAIDAVDSVLSGTYQRSGER